MEKKKNVWNKWLALKVLEFLFCCACVVCKRVTDDKTIRINLLFQKYSREWFLLRNVLWGRFGQAFGDAVYGGYCIITFGLILAHIYREIPQKYRIMEFFMLGLGVLLYVIVGSLELFAIDDLPRELIPNAIVLGTLTIVTGLLFLIDLAGPRLKTSSLNETTNQTTQYEDTSRMVNKLAIVDTSNEPIQNGTPKNHVPVNGVQVMITDKENGREKQKNDNKKSKKSKKQNIVENQEINERQLTNILENREPVVTVSRESGVNQEHMPISKEPFGSVSSNIFEKLEKLDVDKLEKLQMQLDEWEHLRKSMKGNHQESLPGYNNYEKKSQKIQSPEMTRHIYRQYSVSPMSVITDRESLSRTSPDQDSPQTYVSDQSSPRTDSAMHYSSRSESRNQSRPDSRGQYSPRTDSGVQSRMHSPKADSSMQTDSEYHPGMLKSTQSQTDAPGILKTDTQQKSLKNMKHISISDYELNRYSKSSPWQRVYYGNGTAMYTMDQNVRMMEPIKKEQVVSYMLPLPTLIEEHKLKGAKEMTSLEATPPNNPCDPGYVQYAAKQWGEKQKDNPKTPRHSPV